MSAPAVLGVHSPTTPWIAEIGLDRTDRYTRIDDLCQAMEAVCASAVDPLEVAAALEFEGMSDRSARERYAMPTVFALAEEMYWRVPRQPAEPVPVATQRGGIGRSALRGRRRGWTGLAFGLLAPALVLVPVLPGPRTDTGAGTADAAAAVALAAVCLSLSMVAAEWCVSSYRRRIRRLLRSTHRLGGFGWWARLALLQAVGQYLTVALVLVIAVGPSVTRLDRPTLTALVSFLTLGCAMFVSRLLLAHDCGPATVLACAAALSGEILFHDAGAWTRPLVFGGLLALLGGYAAVVLGRATRHAW
jgi:hypothetical protein